MCRLRMAQSTFKKLFVYGTLKAGEPNHHWLSNLENGYSKYICKATTTKKMPLVLATRYNIPFLLDKSGVGNYVTGEIYEIDDKMMEKLDILEDYPKFYDREVQDMNIGIGEGSLACWVYLLKKFPEEMLTLPTLSDYKNLPEHPYTERSQRTEKFSAKDDLSYRTAVN